MKKAIGLAVIGIFVISLIGIISAENVVSDNGYNWWTDIHHSLTKYGLFTAEGQSRQCSVNADKTINPAPAGHVYPKTELAAYCGGKPSFLIDVFDISWHFLQEYRAESFTQLTVNTTADRILEIYCCPYNACSSNSDCSVSPASNYGNTCNTAYGSCYNTAPTYTTSKYNCVSGSWVASGTASNGQSRFCSSSSLNNYLDQTGNEHCATSPSSSWCTTGSQCKTNAQSCTDTSQCCSGLTCQNFGCYPQSSCGDGACQSTETFSSCPSDCGSVPICGNGQCEAGETIGATYYCQTDCGNTQINNTGKKQVGEGCSVDTDCLSNTCEQKTWWLTEGRLGFSVPWDHKVCQPIPWSKSQRIAVEKEELSTMTMADMLAVACMTNSQCIPPSSNYTAKCINLEVLKNEGAITSATGFLDSAKTTIDSVIGGATLGAVAGVGMCVFVGGGTVVAVVASGGAATPLFVPAAATCTALIGAGAAIGAGAGYSFSQLTIADKDDPLVKALRAKDSTQVGLCIAEPKPASYNFGKYTEWAAFINITGDKAVDGLIIIIILIAILFLFLK